MLIRHATDNDLTAVKAIANQYRAELGYVMWPKLREAVVKQELTVIEMDGVIVGFANWHLRRDGWATVYEIAVMKGYTGKGLGKALLGALPRPLRLKCTVDNTFANAFYAKAGMTLVRTEAGRKRALNVWEVQS